MLPQRLALQTLGPDAVQQRGALHLAAAELAQLRVGVEVAAVVGGHPPVDLNILRVEVDDVLVVLEKKLGRVFPPALANGLDNVPESLLMMRFHVNFSHCIHDNRSGVPRVRLGYNLGLVNFTVFTQIEVSKV